MKTKNYLKILILTFYLLPTMSIAQGVAINEDDTEADPSAMLDIKSSDKGLLIPRMTEAEITSIVNPANGLMVFNTDDNQINVFVSGDNEWKKIGFGTGTISPTFTCGNPLFDYRDGQTYSTVQIGTQCWMAENLNIGTMINGTSSQTDNVTIEKYCYDDNTSNCDTYGGLYEWDEMMEYSTTPGTQGICPTGWHVPSDAEWCVLEQEVDATVSCSGTGLRGTDVGGKLKEIGTSHWASPNTGATNSSSFTVLPSGYRLSDGSFLNLSTNSYFRTSNEDGSNAWSRGLGYNNAQVYRTTSTKVYGFSVRCIKD